MAAVSIGVDEEELAALVYSRRQQRALAARMPNTPVELGMSYGSLSLAEAIDKLLAQGVTNTVVLCKTYRNIPVPPARRYGMAWREVR